MRDEITTLIWGAKDAFSIPRYLLFDKDGLLVEKELLSPGDTEKLYHQIEGKLNSP